MKSVISLILPLGVAIGLAGCASKPDVAIDDEFYAADVGEVQPNDILLATKPRTTVLIPDVSGRDDFATGRPVVVTQDTQVTLVENRGRRALVKMENGRRGFVYIDDFAPLPEPEPIMPVLPTEGAASGYPIAAEPPPEPVDRALIEQANELDMPE